MHTPPNSKPARAQRDRPEAAPLSQDQVLRVFLDNPTKVLAYRQLSRRLGVTRKQQREEVFSHLKTLRKKGVLTLVQNDEYRLTDPTTAKAVAAAVSEPKKGKKRGKGEAARPVEAEFGQDPVVHRRRAAGFDHADDSGRADRRQDANTLIGTVDLASPNFAFVIPEAGGDDVRVFTDQMKYALQGDLVRVKLRSNHRDGRPVGDVVEVLKRERPELVGVLQLQGGLGFVKSDNRRVYFDAFIPPANLNGAQNGDKVQVHLLEFPTDPSRQPVGEIMRNFGPAGENEAEINAIMAEFGLPFDFPQAVEAESESIADVISDEEIARRRDFRGITTFTIDPADAKDFDDALSVQQLENGHWEVGVHIADVTHYVRLGTALEKEGKHRATSVYLVDRVIPMLPERLSNGLCSLRPNEDKLTFSAVFELDEAGKLYDAWFGKTIIHSDRRFAYEEAQERIETKQGDYADEVNLLNGIAKQLHAARFRAGAISFETQEVKFRLDAHGKPLGVYVKERKDAHKMIEEFMLLANKKVAEYVFNKKKTKPRLTMVYRVHEAPDPERLENFALFAQKFGYTLNLNNPKKLSKELNQLSEDVVGKPEQNVLQGLAIRTMAKAIYTTEPVGHFGLAFAHYSHFTSPIRRYPDMMAHRLLEHYLQGGKNVDPEPVEEECKHSSAREKLAATAERASIKYKQVEFMKDEIGNTFTGVVSGFNERGMYVEIEENKCEGMVRLSEIPGDTFELDKDNYRIVGRGSKRIIQFGDEVEVVVKSANLLDRTIDFEMVDNRSAQDKKADAARGGESRNSGGGRGKSSSRGGGGKSGKSGGGKGRKGGKGRS